jgi:uncharacterized membrane protein YkoI
VAAASSEPSEATVTHRVRACSTFVAGVLVTGCSAAAPTQPAADPAPAGATQAQEPAPAGATGGDPQPAAPAPAEPSPGITAGEAEIIALETVGGGWVDRIEADDLDDLRRVWEVDVVTPAGDRELVLDMSDGRVLRDEPDD